MSGAPGQCRAAGLQWSGDERAGRGRASVRAGRDSGDGVRCVCSVVGLGAGCRRLRVYIGHDMNRSNYETKIVSMGVMVLGAFCRKGNVFL